MKIKKPWQENSSKHHSLSLYWYIINKLKITKQKKKLLFMHNNEMTFL